MDTRIPELDQSVRAASSTAATESQSKRDDESRAQQAALEALVDRVNAARTVV